MEGGGLLFMLSPFIHVNTGLAKGEMNLTEFYRATIVAFLPRGRLVGSIDVQSRVEGVRLV